MSNYLIRNFDDLINYNGMFINNKTFIEKIQKTWIQNKEFYKNDNYIKAFGEIINHFNQRFADKNDFTYFNNFIDHSLRYFIIHSRVIFKPLNNDNILYRTLVNITKYTDKLIYKRMSDYDKKRFKYLNDYSRLFAEQLYPEDFNDVITKTNINIVDELKNDESETDYSSDDFINDYEQEIIKQEGYDYCEDIEDYSDYEF